MAMSRQEMDAMIVQRAWKDDAFRDEFITDPKATIEKYSGQKLPPELNFVALAEDDKTIHFVIPAKPPKADELSDEDLEKVAGGMTRHRLHHRHCRGLSRVWRRRRRVGHADEPRLVTKTRPRHLCSDAAH